VTDRESGDVERPVLRTEHSGEHTMREKKILYTAHETAIIDEGCEIGAETKIWQFTHICRYAQIGKNVTIGQGCYIGPEVEIGNGCRIQNHVSIFEGVILDDDVFIGPGTMFTNVINPRAFINRRHAFKRTSVGKGSTIGANCTIICGHGLGRYCFIGAGAVVTRDVEPFSMRIGCPAVHVSWISKEGHPQINRPGM